MLLNSAGLYRVFKLCLDRKNNKLFRITLNLFIYRNNATQKAKKDENVIIEIRNIEIR